MEIPEFGKPETGGFGEVGKPDHLQIRHASTELALKALETFPLDVDSWTAEFMAAEAGPRSVPILPGTRLRWTNSNRGDVLIPAPNQFDLWHPSRRAELPDPLINGVRFATHEFEAEGDDSYRELKQRFMDQLLESGYGLRDASVWAEDERISLHISDTVGGQNIRLSIADREIATYQDFSEAVEEELRGWFERLSQRNKQEHPVTKKTS
jgi:hypothetical protein